MLAKAFISCFAVSALMTVPSEIVTAKNIAAKNDNVRVTVNRDGDVTISNPSGTIVVPNSSTANRFPPNHLYRIPVAKSPQLLCSGKTVTNQSIKRNSSNTAINRTYSSTTTTICKQ